MRIIYHLVLDCITVLFLGLFWRSGYKSGIIRSVLYLVGTITSVIIISLSCRYVASFIFDNFLYSFLEKLINKSLLNIGFINQHKILENLPWLIRVFIPSDDFGNKYIGNIVTTKNNGEFVIALINLISPIIINVLTGVCAAVIYWIFSIIIKFIVNYVSKIFKFPVLTRINGMLGGVFGILKGICVLWVFICIFNIFAASNSRSFKLMSQDNINSSLIFKKIYKFNPVSFIFLFEQNIKSCLKSPFCSMTQLFGR
ncbi:MAG: CvpA family protein [Candidatus Improbicoccus devescovinae]|nr:MAG: CvpA family protein [Candidatus Improbicoccus devescovinae]